MSRPINHIGSSPLAPHIKQFIDHKRSIGRKYENEEIGLRLFERYLLKQKIRSLDDITPALIQDFLASRPRKKPRSYNLLLGAVRVLFRWLVARQIVRRSPVIARPRRGSKTRIPVIFKPEEVRRLLELTGSLSDKYGGKLRGPTYRTAFAVLYSLGLRVGEVCRLRQENIDWDHKILTIRKSKFGKSRLVPFGPKLGKLLGDYIDLRKKQGDLASSNSLVFSVHGKLPLRRQALGKVLRALAPQIGISRPGGLVSPRIHDFRHTFAVRTLLRWYRSGINPSERLIHLSTFMGHVQPESTAIYLTITTELLEVAGERYERFANSALPKSVLP